MNQNAFVCSMIAGYLHSISSVKITEILMIVAYTNHKTFMNIANLVVLS